MHRHALAWLRVPKLPELGIDGSRLVSARMCVCTYMCKYMQCTYTKSKVRRPLCKVLVMILSTLIPTSTSMGDKKPGREGIPEDIKVSWFSKFGSTGPLCVPAKWRYDIPRTPTIIPTAQKEEI